MEAAYIWGTQEGGAQLSIPGRLEAGVGGRVKASSWQPDVGGESEEEIGASQVAGREGRNLEGQELA